jgi:hypothetical protein
MLENTFHIGDSWGNRVRWRQILAGEESFRDQTAAIRSRILDLLTQLPWDGISFTHQIPGLSLYRIIEPAGPFSTVYEPSLSLIIKGSKRLSVGGETFVYGESCFFLTAIGLPMTGQICEASKAEPYVAATLRLNLEALRRLIAEHGLHPTNLSDGDRGIAVGAATPELFGFR